jgi:hypothetical protein
MGAHNHCCGRRSAGRPACIQAPTQPTQRLLPAASPPARCRSHALVPPVPLTPAWSPAATPPPTRSVACKQSTPCSCLGMSAESARALITARCDGNMCVPPRPCMTIPAREARACSALTSGRWSRAAADRSTWRRCASSPACCAPGAAPSPPGARLRIQVRPCRVAQRMHPFGDTSAARHNACMWRQALRALKTSRRSCARCGAVGVIRVRYSATEAYSSSLTSVG